MLEGLGGRQRAVMDPNNTGLGQRLRGSLVTLVALYVNNVRFAQCATSVGSISTDIGDEERLERIHLMHSQMGKYANVFCGKDSLGLHSHRKCSVQIPSIAFRKTGWKHHRAAPSAPDSHDLGICTTCTRRIADKTPAQSTYKRSTSETGPH